MLRTFHYFRTHSFPLFIVCTNIIYAWLIALTCTPVDTVDYSSTVTEGLLAILPMVGMFMSVGLQKEESSVFHPLMIGLALLSVSMSTDLLDELYNEPNFANTLFEGVFQVIGFGLVLLSLHRWVKHSHALNVRLHELAHTDSLTNIANRRHFIASLDGEIARTKRTSDPLSLISIDIDHFKQLNDTFGHGIGDEVLQAVTQVIGSKIRSTDLLARTGGEEFIILAPNCDINDAAILAEKCRSALETATMPNAGKVTASFGVTQLSKNQSADEIIKEADRALYKAKSAGRNKVEITEQSVLG